jgi:hypothetical protein
VAVAFSVQSAFDWAERNGSASRFPFWRVCDGLIEQKQPLDVVMFPEGVLRPDVMTVDDLSRYRTLILPQCSSLTPEQAAVVRAFLDRGGHVLATGEVGLNLDDTIRSAILGHPRMLRTTEVLATDFAGGPQVTMEGAPDLAINVQKIGDKQAAIHVVRYDYDEERDEVPVLPRMRLDIRLARPFRMVKTFSPLGEVSARLTYSRDVREMHRLDLGNVPLYLVALLQG